MKYITEYFLYIEIFVFCFSFSIAIIFSENIEKSNKKFLKDFLKTLLFFSIFFNAFMFIGYRGDIKENNYLNKISSLDRKCIDCMSIPLKKDFFDECNNANEFYIYQGFRKYSFVNSNKYYQYIIFNNNNNKIIKDNKYFSTILNFNSLYENVITINKKKQYIYIPKEIINNNHNINIINELKEVYNRACNFTPPKN